MSTGLIWNWISVMIKSIICICGIIMISCDHIQEKPAAQNSGGLTDRKQEMDYDKNRGIVNNANSAYVKLKSIDLGDCQWTKGFWAEKWKLAEEVMVPHMGTLLKGDIGHGYNNFKIAAGLKQGTHKGFWWHDGDFYKWMEASLYIYAVSKDEKIVNELDEIIGVIGQAQQEDGYLSTPIIIRDDLDPFTNRRYHELYNSGHLLTSACIHYRVNRQN